MKTMLQWILRFYLERLRRASATKITIASSAYLPFPQEPLSKFSVKRYLKKLDAERLIPAVLVPITIRFVAGVEVNLPSTTFSARLPSSILKHFVRSPSSFLSIIRESGK